MPSSERYQRLIGSLLYLAVNSRPDIAASVTILRQYNRSPTKSDWNEAKRIAWYLKGTADYELRFGEKNGVPGAYEISRLLMLNKYFFDLLKIIQHVRS